MIIDFHTHIFPAYFRDQRRAFFSKEPGFEMLYRSPEARLAGREDLIDLMDEEKVDKSVVFGFPWEEADHFRRHNDYVIESVNRHPDRLAGFCCFSPLAPEAPREAERCLQAGLSGMGELAFYASGLSSRDIEALRDVMDIGLRFDVPVMIHANEPVGHAYPGKTPMKLHRIYELIKTYPANRIVLAHWGGGLWFYGLMKKEVRETLVNTWFDTAASPYLYNPEIYRIAGEIIGFERVLFGSDYPLLRPERYFKEMASANLSSRALRKVSGENAARLLGLAPEQEP